MPRWPRGLTPAAGSGIAYGGRPIRPPRPPQRHYWRHTATELHAGANAVFVNTGPAPGGTPIYERASVGPTAAGERWVVRLVQVTLPGLYASPPLVTQQSAAQNTGQTTQPPPPFATQVWLSAGGVNIHLLAQTTQGGNDTLDLAGQVVTPGEAITVLWWSTASPPGPGFPGLGWMVVRGTRYALNIV